MLISEKIQFLSLNVSLSKFSCVRFRLFVAGNIYVIVFPHFRFLIILVLWILVLSLLFLLGVISHSLFFSRQPLNHCTNASTVSSVLQVFFLLFLTHIACQRHLKNVRPCASSWLFLFPGLFVEVLPLSTLRMVPSILRGDQPGHLSL